MSSTSVESATADILPRHAGRATNEPLIRRGSYRVEKKGVKGDLGWVFRSIFKKKEYKGRQEEIMQAALQKADVLVIAPTGMGKSLCFQVPAVTESHGLTLVISPLLSLMSNQVQALNSLGIKAAMLSSKSTPAQQRLIFDDMASGHPQNRLLYVTPERLVSPHFRTFLRLIHKHQELNRLVVDEAHCISEWGHDFRPDYAKLGEFRGDFPEVPIMALTASATPKVQNDIVTALKLDVDVLFQAVHSFNRANLFYEVQYFSESEPGGNDFRRTDLLNFVRKCSKGRPSSGAQAAGIIYCRAKKTCDELAQFLKSNGIHAASYHRGVRDDEAEANQQKWLHNEELATLQRPRVDCIVATIAFGMGIDKEKCRFVVHYDLPKSFEGYYQETGRAGRDNHAARCLMYYSSEDRARVERMVGRTYEARLKRSDQDPHMAPAPSQRANRSIAALIEFVENVTLCRHVLICRFFGEKVAPDDTVKYCDRMCDICKDPGRTRARRDAGLVSLDFEATQKLITSENKDHQHPYDYEGDDERHPNCYQPSQPWAHDEEEHDSIEQNPDDENWSTERLADNLGARHRTEGFRSAAVEMHRKVERSKVLAQLCTSPPGTALDSRNSIYENEPILGNILDLDPLEDVQNEQGPCHVSLPEQPCSSLTATSFRKPHVLAGVYLGVESLARDDGLASQMVEQTANKSKIIRPKQIAPFKAPFMKSDRTNSTDSGLQHVHRPANSSIALSMENVPDFEVNPAHYEKPISMETRRDGVLSIWKRLCEALLSKHGHRSSESEESFWRSLGAEQARHEDRQCILLQASIIIESDLFWCSLTTPGYEMFLTVRLGTVHNLASMYTIVEVEEKKSLDDVIVPLRLALKSFGKLKGIPRAAKE